MSAYRDDYPLRPYTLEGPNRWTQEDIDRMNRSIETTLDTIDDDQLDRIESLLTDIRALAWLIVGLLLGVLVGLVACAVWLL